MERFIVFVCEKYGVTLGLFAYRKPAGCHWRNG